jgi:hypothetical protein
MGRLVPFRLTQRPRPKPGEGYKEAQIIVFTGVRYAREPSEPPRGSSPSSGTRRRRG